MFAKVPVTKASSAVNTSLNLKFFSYTGILFFLQILITFCRVIPLTQNLPVDV